MASFFIALALGAEVDKATVLPQNDSGILRKGSYRVEFSSGDEKHAERIMAILEETTATIMQDLALNATPRVRVILTASEMQYNVLTEDSVPVWAQGVAASSSGQTVIVLKSPKWSGQEAEFKGIVVHELAHAILAEAVQFQHIPRWFNEGLAVFYSNERRWISTSAVSKALFTKTLIALEDIEHLNDYSEVKAQLAYQQSHLAVRFLLEQYGKDAMRAIIAGLREEKHIDEIFSEAIGVEFWEFENQWLTHIEEKYRLNFLVDAQSYLWLGILFLTGAAFIMVRLRRRKILREWQYEEDALNTTDNKEGNDI